MNNAKKQRKTIEWERLELSSRKLEISNNILCKDGDNKGQKQQGPTEAEEIKKTWQQYTEELYKKGLNEPDNPMVWSLTYSRTSWNVKSSGP